MQGTCQGNRAGKRQRRTVVVPGKLNLRTKLHWNAHSISQTQGQPSTPSTPTWGRACPSWCFFFFEESLLFGTWMGSPVCWAHIATPKIWAMVYTETALYHKTVSKTQQRKDHHINPELTYYSLSSSQWAAENYSFILLTNNIFKKILENECFHDWHRYSRAHSCWRSLLLQLSIVGNFEHGWLRWACWLHAVKLMWVILCF